MQKFSTKTIVRDPQKTARVKKTATIAGVSTREVYRVICGDVSTEKDQAVLEIYMELQEGEEEVYQNLLLKAVKQAVPL